MARTADKARVIQLTLANGWSVSVVTSADGLGPGTVPDKPIPTADNWRSLLETLTDDPASMPGYEVLKYSKGNEVFRARLAWRSQSLEVVCKQFGGRGFWRRVFAAWRPSKERVNFDRGLTLLHAGIATALPLAVVERRRPRREAWLVTEFIPDAVDLDQVALTLLPRLKPDRRRRVKDAILKEIVDLFDRMGGHGFHHRDMKASNILLTNWDSHDEPVCTWLVDLEGFRLRGSSSRHRRRQPLVRLAASLLGYASVTRTDFWRFLQAYLGRTGVPPETWKRHFRELADQATDYVRRAKLRKTDKLDGYAE